MQLARSLVGVVAICALSRAQTCLPGQLDTSFGSGGKVSYQLSGFGTEASVVVVERPDGKLLAAKELFPFAPPYQSDVGITLFTATGAIDANYGSGGTVRLDLLARDTPTAIELLPDGTFLVAGYACTVSSLPDQTDAFVAKFLADGQLDTSFGSAGIVWLAPTSWYEYASDLCVQSDGRILVCGHMVFGSVYIQNVFRLLADGALDPSFGFSGWSNFVTPSGVGWMSNMRVTSAGSIFLVGTEAGSPSCIDIAHMGSDGTFYGHTLKSFPNQCASSGNDIWFPPALGIDDRILVAGSVERQAGDGFRTDGVLLQFDSSFALDPLFGDQGVVTFAASPNRNSFHSVARTADGKVLASGASFFNLSHSQHWAARFDIDGTPDVTFGTGGSTLTQLSVDNGVRGILLADGDLLTSSSGANYSHGLVRYCPSPPCNAGQADVYRFGHAGRAAATIGFASDDEAHVVLPRAANDFALVGTTRPTAGAPRDLAFAIFLPNGLLDRDFGGFGTGKFSLDLGDDESVARAWPGSFGTFYVAGDTRPGAAGQAYVTHCADEPPFPLTSFGGTGWVIFGTPNEDRVRGALRHTDGRIVVAGYSVAANGQRDTFLARVLPNGTLDTSFGSGGLVVQSLYPGHDEAADVALTANGNYVVLGVQRNGPKLRTTLARFLPNGVRDVTFGANGLWSRVFGAQDDPRAVSVEPNGRIVAFGASSNSAGGPTYAMSFAVQANGSSLDTSYATLGVFRSFAGGFAAGFKSFVRRPNGAYFVVGSSTSSPGSPEAFFTFALTAGGRPDLSFTSTGAASWSLSPNAASATAVMLTTTDELLVAGKETSASTGLNSMLGTRWCH